MSFELQTIKDGSTIILTVLLIHPKTVNKIYFLSEGQSEFLAFTVRIITGRKC
jgi:hypothetical protein